MSNKGSRSSGTSRSSTGRPSGSGSMRESAATEQLRSLRARPRQRKMEESDEAKLIVPRLAKRAYHLPGNGWCRDWFQYMMNNHPLLGICCHHRLHPLKIGQRTIIFIGSIASGLAITNIVFLWFSFDREQDMNDVLFQLTILPNSTAIHTSYQSVEVTRGTAVLWTLGSMTHSIFDLSIWYISACSCCRPGGICAAIGCLRHCGSYLVVGVVMVVVAIATLVVVWRASEESREQYEEEMEEMGVDDDVAVPRFGEIRGVSSFSFLMNYAIEVTLALLVYYPLFGTVLFSGVFGCGRIPVLGGRPRELHLEQKRQQRRANRGSSTLQRRSSTSDSDIFDDEMC